MPMISVLGKMFLWQREGPGGRWTCQTSRRGETRDRRCDLGGDGKLRSRVLRWQEENYSGLEQKQEQPGWGQTGHQEKALEDWGESQKKIMGLQKTRVKTACQLRLARGKNQEKAGRKPKRVQGGVGEGAVLGRGIALSGEE